MKKNKKESNIRDLWDNIKHANLYIIGVPEAEEGEKGIKNVFEEIIAENFPNLKKKTDIQVQKAQRVPAPVEPVVLSIIAESVVSPAPTIVEPIVLPPPKIGRASCRERV